MMPLTQELKVAKNSEHFFSLKWKAVIVLSIVILFINALVFGFHYAQLKKRYAEERETNGVRNFLILDSVSKKHVADSQHFSTIIPTLFGLNRVLDENNWALAEEMVHLSWPRIQAEYGIDRVIFFDTAQNAVVDSEFEKTPLVDSEKIFSYLDEVKKSVAPEWFIQCSPRCTQVTFVPYLSKSSRVSVIVSFSSIADTVLEYKKLTGVDIGMLVPLKATERQASALPAWNAVISALTDSQKLLPLLKDVSNRKSLQQLTNVDYRTEFQDAIYTVKLLPASMMNADPAAFIVLIENITEQIEQLQATTRESVVMALAGLVVSEIVLLGLLWRPLSRLKRTSLTLPLLAKGEFETVRNKLKLNKNTKAIVSDEIDLVHNSAINLSYQLEKLNDDVAQYTKSLAFNMDQLRLERDFVQRLLDTAQLLIVTHDSEGKIVQVNSHALMLVGGSENEVIGKEFNQVFVDEQDRANVLDLLTSVRGQKDAHVRVESGLSGPTGIKSIAWVHSHLRDDVKKLGNVLSVGLDISERKEAERRIAWLANHDPLTGLFNRRYFNDVFETILKRSARYERKGALLYLDLDNFKYINDTQGHNAGDRLIEEVALALRRITRETDIVARIGGDEFAIVIQDVDKRGIIDFCRDLNRRIAGTVRPRIRGGHQTSASIGIALYPEHGKTVNDLLANADIAMYQAKERGKGVWHLFSEQEQAREKIQHQMNWKEKIDMALATDNFLLYFQPILDIRRHRVTHYEVLLRMRDQNGTIVSPHSFIEIAENTGLISSIDQLVLAKTLRALRAMGTRAGEIKLSINLSARTFSDRKILPLLERSLRNNSVPNQNLIFEITETAALQDISAACDAIESLQNMGCGIAIDDFGVGFSSFYYLRELPVDYVKIDGSFIQQLAKNSDDQLIVRAMSQIVKGFGKKTIAEYVEDEATLQILKKYQVDYAQGFYIGIPQSQSVWDLETEPS